MQRLFNKHQQSFLSSQVTHEHVPNSSTLRQRSSSTLTYNANQYKPKATVREPTTSTVLREQSNRNFTDLFLIRSMINIEYEFNIVDSNHRGKRRMKRSIVGNAVRSANSHRIQSTEAITTEQRLTSDKIFDDGSEHRKNI
jgi:hypothetical protein